VVRWVEEADRAEGRGQRVEEVADQMGMGRRGEQ